MRKKHRNEDNQKAWIRKVARGWTRRTKTIIAQEKEVYGMDSERKASNQIRNLERGTLIMTSRKDLWVIRRRGQTITWHIEELSS